MLPTHLLKRFFPNAPDWLLEGLLLVSILWLIVVPIEIVNIAIRQEYFPVNILGWIARFLYMWGYVISLFLISPLLSFSSVSDQLAELVIVFLGLLIASPAYFMIGALSAIRRTATINLGVLLMVINIIFNCFATLRLLGFLSLFSDY